MSDPARNEVVRYELRHGAAWLTLDSPHNRNAISSVLLEQLHAAVRRADDDVAARAVVLGHTGGTFCAGADLSEAGDPALSAGDLAGERARAFMDFLRAWIALPKPTIALIDGHVRAGGMGLVAACDFAFAGPASTFAVTEVRLGLAPAMVSVPLLARLGTPAAARYFLTGAKFGADEAAASGLVTAAEEPATAVASLLSELRACSPQGLAASKSLLTRGVLDDLDRHGGELAAMSAALFDTPESREGMTAFLEKRPPSWAADPDGED